MLLQEIGWIQVDNVVFDVGNELGLWLGLA